MDLDFWKWFWTGLTHLRAEFHKSDFDIRSILEWGNPIFSLPGQSPGGAIVLPPALVLALALAAAALAKC